MLNAQYEGYIESQAVNADANKELVFDDYFDAICDLKKSSQLAIQLASDNLPKSVLAVQRMKGAAQAMETCAKVLFQKFIALLPWSIDDQMNAHFENLIAPMPSVSEIDFVARVQMLSSKINDQERIEWERIQNMFSAQVRLGQIRRRRQETNGSLELRLQAESEFSSEIRSFLYACRAYQDAIACAVIEFAENANQPGKHTSMDNLLKKPEPDFVAALEQVTGYQTWFNEMRDLRNLAKVGALAELHGFGHGLYVVFQDARSGTHVAIGSKKFGMKQAADALKYSAHLMREICPNRSP